MKKFSLLIGFVLLVSLLLHRPVRSEVARSMIQLTTEPPIEQLIPFEAEATARQMPVQLSLQASDPTRQPIQNAKIHLQLFTPPRNPWLTTDFPIVEGTKLLDLEAIAPAGAVQLQQMLPIRGRYRLQVAVTPIAANTFRPFEQTLSLPVRENPVKHRNFALLAAIVLAAGLVGGWVIGGQQTIRPGEIAPQRVRLLLSGATVVAIVALLAVNLSGLAQHHADLLSPDGAAIATRSQGLELSLLGDTQATVGQPATLIAQIKDATTGQPVTEATFKIQVTSLEDGWTAFAHQSIPDSAGRFEWQQQFFDGAPHQVTVEALPRSTRQFAPLQVVEVIEVEGVAPPLLARLTTLLYLILTLGLGIAIGLWRQSSISIRR